MFVCTLNGEGNCADDGEGARDPSGTPMYGERSPASIPPRYLSAVDWLGRTLWLHSRPLGAVLGLGVVRIGRTGEALTGQPRVCTGSGGGHNGKAEAAGGGELTGVDPPS
eukprot:5201427-Pyramimonas_sp.AAC.3